MDLIMAGNQISVRFSCLDVHVDMGWSFQNGTWWVVECLHGTMLVLAKRTIRHGYELLRQVWK